MRVTAERVIISPVCLQTGRSYLENIAGETGLRDYELMMVLSPQVDEEASAALLERVSQVITDGGGTVTRQEPWGTRRLAYPINEFREGSYVLTHLSLEPAAVGGLDAHLKTVSDVIRHLLVKRETKTGRKSEDGEEKR